MAGGGSSAYAGSKFALEGFTDSIRKELRPLGVAVVGINPGMIKTPLLEKLPRAMKQLDHDNAEWLSLYARYMQGLEEAIDKYSQHADTTDATDRDILHALLSERPSSRYFSGGLAGTPAVVVAFLARVLPAYAQDFMMENLS